MNLVELTAIKNHLQKQINDLESIRINCASCENLQSRVCKKFQAVPPDDWMRKKADCAEWIWDTIPF
jgi:translation initiation factor 2B subunit (eIF-2B alpha/beta/delta family)